MMYGHDQYYLISKWMISSYDYFTCLTFILYYLCMYGSHGACGGQPSAQPTHGQDDYLTD